MQAGRQQATIEKEREGDRLLAPEIVGDPERDVVHAVGHREIPQVDRAGAEAKGIDDPAIDQHLDGRRPGEHDPPLARGMDGAVGLGFEVAHDRHPGHGPEALIARGRAREVADAGAQSVLDVVVHEAQVAALEEPRRGLPEAPLRLDHPAECGDGAVQAEPKGLAAGRALGRAAMDVVEARAQVDIGAEVGGPEHLVRVERAGKRPEAKVQHAPQAGRDVDRQDQLPRVVGHGQARGVEIRDGGAPVAVGEGGDRGDHVGVEQRLERGQERRQRNQDPLRLAPDQDPGLADVPAVDHERNRNRPRFLRRRFSEHPLVDLIGGLGGSRR